MKKYRRQKRERRKEKQTIESSGAQQEPWSSKSLGTFHTWILLNFQRDKIYSTQLFALAGEQRKEEKKDLTNFFLSRSSKSLSAFLENIRKLETDKTEFAFQKITLLRIQ